MSDELIDDWFPIIGPSGKPAKPNAAIRLRIKFTSCTDRNKGDAIDTDELFGLKDSYFPVTDGGNVKLYQDAHVREGQLPEIELVWYDKTSHNAFFIKTEGLMQTHDEETLCAFISKCSWDPIHPSSKMCYSGYTGPWK